MEKVSDIQGLVILLNEDLNEKLADLTETDSNYQVIAESIKLVAEIDNLKDKKRDLEKFLNDILVSIDNEELSRVNLAKAEIASYFLGVLKVYLI
jgi:molecular chaperone GrpE (heat shock protein)